MREEERKGSCGAEVEEAAVRKRKKKSDYSLGFLRGTRAFVSEIHSNEDEKIDTHGLGIKEKILALSPDILLLSPRGPRPSTVFISLRPFSHGRQ